MFQTEAMTHTLVTCHSHFLSLLGGQCWLQTGQPGLGAATAGPALAAALLPDRGGGLASCHRSPGGGRRGEEKGDGKGAGPECPPASCGSSRGTCFSPKPEASVVRLLGTVPSSQGCVRAFQKVPFLETLIPKTSSRRALPWGWGRVAAPLSLTNASFRAPANL